MLIYFSFFILIFTKKKKERNFKRFDTLYKRGLQNFLTWPQLPTSFSAMPHSPCSFSRFSHLEAQGSVKAQITWILDFLILTCLQGQGVSSLGLLLVVKNKTSFQFSSGQSLSRVWLFATPCQASLSITNYWRSLKLMPNSCQWCHPTVSSSVFTFSSHLQSFPASGLF